MKKYFYLILIPILFSCKKKCYEYYDENGGSISEVCNRKNPENNTACDDFCLYDNINEFNCYGIINSELVSDNLIYCGPNYKNYFHPDYNNMDCGKCELWHVNKFYILNNSISDTTYIFHGNKLFCNNLEEINEKVYQFEKSSSDTTFYIYYESKKDI